jgi:deferrochelatase/peroxidase EfeB
VSDEKVNAKKLSRRDLFRVTGAAGAGLALGAGGYAALARTADAQDAGGDTAGGPEPRTVVFRGAHQAGIATAQQEHLHFAALDLVTEEVSEVRDLLRAWTEAAARMTRGETAGDDNFSEFLPPEDTGEAFDLSPARLTLTFGFGPSLFGKDGEDRFGLADLRPDALAPLPPLTGDVLDEGRSDGDLCIQACADDPQVAFHAVRNLVRISRGLAVVRWSQLGFGRTASTSKAQATPRNLFGMKDGTNNIKAEDEALMDRHVWVPEEDGPPWMVGGTYLVARRIRMLIEVWDRVSLGEQEASIGRHKYTGAPIGKEGEFDPVDLRAKDEAGEPLIAPDAHVRLARQSDEEKILRRGYSFTDGFDAERGQLDAGLFFISFQRDAHKQFVPLQERLAANDRLNEYIRHTSSALFACPPGASEDGYVGEGLFDDA